MKLSKARRFVILLVALSFSLLNACQSEDKVRLAAKEKLNEAPEAKIVPNASKDGMVLIPTGTFQMGGDNNQARQDEFPKHGVQIDSFWMDETEVTNEQFQAFVSATGYVTVAERPIDWDKMKQEVAPNTPKPPDSLLQPGSLVFVPTATPVSLNNHFQWWAWKIGADWQHPEGPDSDIADRMDHPVVQVAWEDAAAYAKWAGKRLPTEAEWEWAARGGRTENIYPWGNEDVNKGEAKANFWQGMFPYQNTEQDGYFGTAPVKTFPANPYGLYDMAGNVWEWCADWYRYDYYQAEQGEVQQN
ncbi:MAG: formylglycine-generating enzyme family protein, partial [Bacteroidota bacterium]